MLEKLSEIEKAALESLATASDGPALEAWLTAAAEIQPAEIHLYSLDRYPADNGVEKVRRSTLDEIASEAAKRTAARVSVF